MILHGTYKQAILKNQSRDPVLKIVYEWTTEHSRPVLRTPATTASQFLLENYLFFPNLRVHENIKLIFINTQPLKNNNELPQYTDDNLSSQISPLCLPLNLFYSAFNKVHENSHFCLDIAH